MTDAKDGVSFFDLASGTSVAPSDTADNLTRSQWLTRDAAARLAIRNHLPLAERTHFGQHKTAKALYAAVIARYSSPATTALSRLILPYLFPELSSFATAEDLIAHLRASHLRYRAALPAEFLAKNPPPMYITLYFIVTRLPDSLRVVRDHFLALPPTDLTVDDLEKQLLAAETNMVAVGAARGTPRTPLFEGAAAARAGEARAAAVAAGGGGVVVVEAEAVGVVAVGVVEGVEVSVVVVAAAVGVVVVEVAVEGAVAVVAAAEVVAAVGAVVPAVVEAVVADVVELFSGEVLVVACASSSSVRTSPSRPSSFVSEYRCFSQLDDAWRAQFPDAVELPRWADLLKRDVDIFALDFDAILAAMYALTVSADGDRYLYMPPDPGIESAALGASESALSGTAPAEALHTFTLDSACGDLYMLLDWPSPGHVHSSAGVESVHTDYCAASGRCVRSGVPVRSLPSLPPSPAPPCLPCVEGRQRAAPHSSSFPPTTAPLHTLDIDVWGPARVQGQGRERYFLLVVDDYSRYTTVFPLRSKGEVPDVLIPWIRAVRLQLRERFQTDLPVLRLHSDRGGEFSSDLLRDFCQGEGILQSFMLPASLQQNGVAECRIGLVMELNLWPRVSLPETSPTLRWTGKVGDASRFRVWGSRAFVRDTTADKLSARAIPGVFLGFVPDAPGWQFYHPTSRRVFPSQDVTFDESVPFYSLFPYRAAPPLPPPLFLAPGPPPPVEVTGDSGAAGGGAARGAESGGAEPERAEPGGAEPERAEPGGAEPTTAEPGVLSVRVRSLRVLSLRLRSLGVLSLRVWSLGVLSLSVRSLGVLSLGVLRLGVLRLHSGSLSHRSSCASGSLAAVAFRVALLELEALELETLVLEVTEGLELLVLEVLVLEALELEALELETLPLVVLELEALGLVALELETLELETLEPVALEALELETLALETLEPEALALEALEVEALELQALKLEALELEALELALLELAVLTLEVLELEALCSSDRFSSRRRSYPVSLTERREPASRPASPVRAVRTARRVPRPRPPPMPGTHIMSLRPSTAPQRVPLPSPPASSLPELPDPESDRVRAASPTVTRLLATVVTDPLFESTAASALVAELVDFAAACRLDYAASLVAESESESVCPPSVGGECALGTDVLEDRQEDFESLAAATAMDAEMASWKSTGTYVDEVPPHGANIVDGMWIFRVKRLPGSPPVFKARYVARGFSQRQGVDFFQTFSPTLKMTTLRVLLHVAAQRDYELHSLDFSTAFLQGSLHEEIWLRRPPGFTGSFPPGIQWSLRRPVYGLRQAPCEWHDTLRTTLVALGFAPSTADPSLFLRTDTSRSPFYILVYAGDLITRDRARRTITLTQSHMVQQVLQRFGFQFSSPQSTPPSTGHSLSAPPSDESVEPSGPYPELVGCLMYLMTCTRPDLAYPLSILARYVAPGRHRREHWEAAKRVLRYLCSTSCMGLVLGGRGDVVLTGHSDASWVDDLATQRSSQGYTFSLGSGSVSWQSTCSSSVLSSSCEAEIYATAMAAQELRWLTYLLTDLGERPHSPPVLYGDNKAALALCQEHRLEHRTKHIALRYFLARELQQRGQLRLAYVDTRANTADIFTKALPPSDHQRHCTALGLVPTFSHLLTA
ncbi:unnamed protein product [Closterium sp. Yama58-4]|nr:unnamed protein product [Closterium sp. Yama58-4]